MEAELFDLHARVEGSHWWFVARRAIIRALLQRVLPPAAGGARPLVVDVGCGTGANIAGLADWCRCVGIDTTERAIALAAERFPGVRFVHGFAPGDLGDAAGAADAFIMTDVLEHVEADAALLASLVHAARPGACFLLTVPADMALWSEHDVQFGHFRRYTAEGFRALWASLPVDELLLSPFNARLYPAIRAARAVGNRVGKFWGRAKSDLGEPPALVNGVLQRIFGGERARLLAVLDGRRPPYRRGVSLVALLRKR